VIGFGIVKKRRATVECSKEYRKEMDFFNGISVDDGATFLEKSGNVFQLSLSS